MVFLRIWALVIAACVAAHGDGRENLDSCYGDSMEATSCTSAVQMKTMGGKARVAGKKGRGSTKIALVQQNNVRFSQGMFEELADGEYEDEALCTAVVELLGLDSELGAIHSVWSSVCGESNLRSRLHKLSDGCLYAPTNSHMQKMEEIIENPVPNHFLAMFERSFFPFQNSKCPTDTPSQTASSLLENTATTCASGSGFLDLNQECLKAELVGITSVGNVRVYKLDGLIGLQKSWEEDLVHSGEKAEVQGGGGALLHRESARVDFNSSATAVNLVIPLKFVVCDNSNSLATETHLKKALEHLNSAFAGTERCLGDLKIPIPEYGVTGISFTWAGRVRKNNGQCSYDCMDHKSGDLTGIAPREDKEIKAVVCDGSRFGKASFPGDPDSSRILAINKDLIPGSVHGDDANRAHGSLVHEMGHYLGLRHTFQGGCGDGDDVADTTPQGYAFSGCTGTQSSCGSSDNLHNFMNYGWDRCTCVFTRDQVPKFWKEISAHMPDMMQLINPLAAKFAMTAHCPGDSSSFTWNFIRAGNTASGRPFFKKLPGGGWNTDVWIYWDPQCAGGDGYYPYWMLVESHPSFTKTKNLAGRGCSIMAYTRFEGNMPPSSGWNGYCGGQWKTLPLSIGQPSLVETDSSDKTVGLLSSVDDGDDMPHPGPLDLPSAPAPSD